MTLVESEQRNRLRGLQRARAAIFGGNSQGAANAIAAARSAQLRLDGGPAVTTTDPTVTTEPSREFTVSPIDAQSAVERIEHHNHTRAQAGSPLLDVDVTRQYNSTNDPLQAWETCTVQVTGADQPTLDALNIGNVRTTPERRVRTDAVLSAAAASVRLRGGKYSPSKNGSDSTPAEVNYYLDDDPTGEWRAYLTPTPEDEARAREVRAWAQAQPDTNDYVRSMKASLDGDYMSKRDVGTASSAFAGYQRHLDQRAQREQRERELLGVGTGPATGLPSNGEDRSKMGGSRWLNNPGDVVTVDASVVSVKETYHESRWTPSHLVYLRTDEGDLIRWNPTGVSGVAEGEQVTLEGKIKAHSHDSGGEKQTEIFYVKKAPPLVYRAQNQVGA